MALRFKQSPVSGNISTLVAGTVTAGKMVFMGNVAQKVANLSAIVNVTAATATLTWTGKWQISNDNTNWDDVHNSNNAAYVVIATGTSAATGDICYDAPPAVYGARYARFVLVNGVATGGTTDLFAISYTYRQLSSGQID
jgi:hypothetical protein